MSWQRVFSNWAIAWVALSGLTLFLAVVPAIAQTRKSEYTLLIGAGFLAIPLTLPPVRRGQLSQWRNYEVNGAGTLTTPGKLVTAAGTFTHKSAMSGA